MIMSTTIKEKEIICPKCRIGTLEPYGTKRDNKTGQHITLIGCDECKYSEEKIKLSVCCNAEMFESGQCTVCGADGTKFED